MNLYVIGPVSGIEDDNRPEFERVSEKLWESPNVNIAITPFNIVECERLQGFPDGWTDIEFRGRPASDAARYKALGNSMAVPVMRWIGERIDRIEKGES